jgi:rhodanese-related sulfurtransferase
MQLQKATDLVAEAKRQIENLSVEQVQKELASGEAVVVDVRDSEERVQNGAIPGSEHVSRGMLEFAADPTLPSYRDVFKPDRRIILHCASGGRSALAAKALKEIGYTNVAHLESGFRGWQEAGAPIEKSQ